MMFASELSDALARAQGHEKCLEWSCALSRNGVYNKLECMFARALLSERERVERFYRAQCDEIDKNFRMTSSLIDSDTKRKCYEEGLKKIEAMSGKGSQMMLSLAVVMNINRIAREALGVNAS